MTAVLFLNSPIQHLARAAVSRHLLLQKDRKFMIHQRSLSQVLQQQHWSSTRHAARLIGKTSSLVFLHAHHWLNLGIPLIVWRKQTRLRFLLVLFNPSQKLQNCSGLILLLTVPAVFSPILLQSSSVQGTLLVSLSSLVQIWMKVRFLIIALKCNIFFNSLSVFQGRSLPPEPACLRMTFVLTLSPISRRHLLIRIFFMMRQTNCSNYILMSQPSDLPSTLGITHLDYPPATSEKLLWLSLMLASCYLHVYWLVDYKMGDLSFQSQRRSWIQAASRAGVKTFGYLFTQPQPNDDPSIGGSPNLLCILPVDMTMFDNSIAWIWDSLRLWRTLRQIGLCPSSQQHHDWLLGIFCDESWS